MFALVHGTAFGIDDQSKVNLLTWIFAVAKLLVEMGESDADGNGQRRRAAGPERTVRPHC